MALADEHTGMVDRLGVAKLEDKGLQAALKEVGRLQGKHIIESILCVIQQAVTEHAPHQRSTLEDTTRIFLLKSKQRPSSIADLGQLHLHAPELALVAQPILAHRLQLSI